MTEQDARLTERRHAEQAGRPGQSETGPLRRRGRSPPVGAPPPCRGGTWSALGGRGPQGDAVLARVHVHGAAPQEARPASAPSRRPGPPPARTAPTPPPAPGCPPSRPSAPARRRPGPRPAGSSGTAAGPRSAGRGRPACRPRCAGPRPPGRRAARPSSVNRAAACRPPVRSKTRWAARSRSGRLASSSGSTRTGGVSAMGHRAVVRTASRTPCRTARRRRSCRRCAPG